MGFRSGNRARARSSGTFAVRLLALALLLLPVLSESAAAQGVLTFTSAEAIWHDAVAENANPPQPTIANGPLTTNATPTTSSISWGSTDPGDPQSGYDVTLAIPDPSTFPVISFTHRNFPVGNPSLVSVELDIVLDFLVNGEQTGPLTFTFTFNHEETPNNQNPCPYPTDPGDGCTDRVTFIDAPDPTTFTVGGKTYTLEMTFLDEDGNPVEEFITDEGGAGNTADLESSFVLVPPVLEVTKSGPATISVGESDIFTIDIQNTGPNDAWNTTIRDVLPDGATSGMCDTAPQVVSAQVFAADGVTPVPGKGPLVAGTDYTLTWAGAPTCELTLAMLTPAAAINTDERLIVTYRPQLDADSQEGDTLTNVAGAIEWYDDEVSNPDRVAITRTLTDGTPSAVDHEDAHTVTVRPHDYLFEKTVLDVTTGDDPALQASPGDLLRYRLRIENRDTGALDGLSVVDELDRLNAVPAFAPGTLTVVTLPPGAVDNSSATGGAQGTGLLDVRNLSVDPGESVLIEFEVTLAPVIANGTFVTNQSQLLVDATPYADSDDPLPNGPADPFVDGDEDPTRVLITSAPAFRVQKISTDLTGDPNILLPGETLRYTITVKNIGNADAVDATLRDAVPANTTYVAGSTRLNGAVVPDGPGGSSPLVAGILIHAPPPEDQTPGAMRADASATTANVATIVFDVVVNAGVANATLLSNQAFAGAVAGDIDQPSDDPDTAAPDDPTVDVVGDQPILFAPKQVTLSVDNGAPGVVEPGDTLHYTITVTNSGPGPATGAVLLDAVPANTTYVVGSTRLNGLAVPDGGVSPLVAGLPISSSDLTPPLPGPGAGTISPGQSAVVEFELLVNAGVPAGTPISNQARVETVELADELTDGDGNPATGPEPTVVIVGDGQQLLITKQVAVVGGGAALPGSVLEYTVTAQNISLGPAIDVVLTDDVNAATPGLLTLVPGTATLNGGAAGVTVVGTLITADYSGSFGPLAPNASAVLRFRATIAAGAATGTTVTNTGTVTWNDPPEQASASVSIDVGGTPGVGLLNGTVWHDADFDDALDPGERLLAGWSVELLENGVPSQSTTTGNDGTYAIGNVVPNAATGVAYQLRFTAPGASASSAKLGRTASAFTNGLQLISDIAVASGSNLQNLDLPIDPNGVVYQSVQRVPVGGVTLTMLSAGTQTPLPAACFDDPAQQGQVTRGDGYYKFDLNFSDGACPSGGAYLIALTAPGPDFAAGYSTLIPPTSGPTTTAFDVPACPGSGNDAIPATAQHCEAQPSELAPPPSVPPRTAGTNYHVHLLLDSSQLPGTSQLFNNHIPIDPLLESLVGITKTTPHLQVSRGQLVPYEISLRTEPGVSIPELSIVDRFPAGFSYVDGSAQLDGVKIEPVRNGRELIWTDVGTSESGQRSLLLLLAVGAGVGEGEFANKAQAFSSLTGTALSGEASATVRVVPDPDFACTDVLGKVFDDANHDGVQNHEEKGIQGVRVATARGLVATTDQHGRFHITCAVIPREDRGSNFVLKLDDRTLPSGYRMTTRTTQVARATQGKALRFQFGASIHRVVGLDLADPVFEPGTTLMREQWKPRLQLLIAELEKQPAILRLSYVADIEDAGLVEQRVRAVKQQITEAWKAKERYPLSIETEVFWRRGGPPEAPRFRLPGAETVQSLLPSVDAGPPVRESSAGRAAERLLPSDEPFTRWSQNPQQLDTQNADKLEQREVTAEGVKTVKLTNVVPPIRFASGVAQIPPSYIEKLRRTLDSMRNLKNVRLHLVGHADDQPLSERLSRVYGDNEGLSEERAGEVAEFLKQALMLPPESISFAWAGASQPIASNATEEGRARNRRVEVEVWYDVPDEKLALEEYVVPAEIRRFKVCRTETVCKLRYREGNQKRARIRNLIAPLHYGDDGLQVPDEFVRQVGQALDNLRDKQNVTVKFVGYTDGAPLTGRNERIYGDALALSKARARRVALAVQDALRLPSSAVASDGLGAARPLASNDTEHGRELNRRVEVEIWHDDPLQQLPDDPQPCPGAAGAEVVTKVYEPPWGAIPSVAIVDGKPQVPAGYADTLRRALGEVADRTRPRLRFVGYTRNERLDRRTALAYGDDIGLSAARARRTMEQLSTEMGLTPAQAEHEGRGFVQSGDVVNAGFIQGDTSYVAVQVVYDELAVVDDNEGVDVVPITRELKPQNPLALNLMRITVDGEPIDDPGRSVADIQRCTDVALDRAEMQFRFDDLQSAPRLSVTSDPIAVRMAPDASAAGPVRFRAYTNYGSYIARSEVRIFEHGQSPQAAPLAVVAVGPDGLALWQPTPEQFQGPVRRLQYLLRAYAADGRFDETRPQSLWMILEDPASQPVSDAQLLAGYGESGELLRNIPLDAVGTVQVHGSGIPPQHTVWLAGSAVPVDASGNFVAEVLLPPGLHTVEVAVLDEAGNGELFLRDLEFPKSDWFYVGIADLTIAPRIDNGRPSELDGKHAPYDADSTADGRLAFYLNGRFAEDWKLTASADTREEPVEDLFSNFLDKSPDALFRRIDPDYHFPTFGDDSTVEEMAPTQGKFFAKLQKDDSHALWGNFQARYLDNELTQVDRGLYGGNLHVEALGSTEHGEKRLVIDGFGAEPGTVPSREEFRGTSGSLYFLNRQDLLQGSERLWIELRDKDSGLVTGVVHLRPTLDYDIDYLQGRILLTEPVAATVADGLLVRNDGLSGSEAWLVVQYEFTPGFDELDALATGGQGHFWAFDFLKFGLTASRNDDDGSDSNLYGADVTLRASTETWLKVQAGRSEGLVSTALRSDDGGFDFFDVTPAPLTDADANAYRVDASIGASDVIEGAPGRLSLYAQRLEEGYSAPGQGAVSETDHVGGLLGVPIGERLDLVAKGDWRKEEDGIEIRAGEVDLGYDLTENWSIGTGVRNELREDDSPVVPLTQEEGERTDAVVQLGYDSKARWRTYAFGQGTIAADGDREDNHRGGIGGAYRVTDRLSFEGESSYGNLGPAVRLGSSFQQTDETRRYFSYAYDNERSYNGLHERRGTLISGVKTRLSDGSSVYIEDRYQHGESSNGLIRAMGMSLAPTDRWSFGANWELGTLFDSRTHAETDRRAGGARVSYAYDRLMLSSGVEYRYDETEQPDKTWDHRTTWLFRNNLRFQVTPSARIVGKLNHSFSDSSLGDFYDGGYTEGVLGYAFRPVTHDRLNGLVKYTYLYNVPTTDQLSVEGNPSLFIQKSHVASIDVSYDLTDSWTLGAKYAYRLGQVSLDRQNPDFFDNNAHLAILRADWRFFQNWELSGEGRLLELPDQDERRAGGLFTMYRYLGDHFKVGVGYNFTDYSEDLTDLSYDHHGVFFNLIGTL